MKFSPRLGFFVFISVFHFYCLGPLFAESLARNSGGEPRAWLQQLLDKGPLTHWSLNMNNSFLLCWGKTGYESPNSLNRDEAWNFEAYERNASKLYSERDFSKGEDFHNQFLFHYVRHNGEDYIRMAYTSGIRASDGRTPAYIQLISIKDVSESDSGFYMRKTRDIETENARPKKTHPPAPLPYITNIGFGKSFLDPPNQTRGNYYYLNFQANPPVHKTYILDSCVFDFDYEMADPNAQK